MNDRYLGWDDGKVDLPFVHYMDGTYQLDKEHPGIYHLISRAHPAHDSMKPVLPTKLRVTAKIYRTGKGLTVDTTTDYTDLNELLREKRQFLTDEMEMVAIDTIALMMKMDRLLESVPFDIDSKPRNYMPLDDWTIVRHAEETRGEIESLQLRLDSEETLIPTETDTYRFNHDVLRFIRSWFSQFVTIFDGHLDRMKPQIMEIHKRVSGKGEPMRAFATATMPDVSIQQSDRELLQQLWDLRPNNLALLEDGPQDGIAQVWFRLQERLQSIEVAEEEENKNGKA